jgi:hypothetical protein
MSDGVCRVPTVSNTMFVSQLEHCSNDVVVGGHGTVALLILFTGNLVFCLSNELSKKEQTLLTVAEALALQSGDNSAIMVKILLVIITVILLFLPRKTILAPHN